MIALMTMCFLLAKGGKAGPCTYLLGISFVRVNECAVNVVSSVGHYDMVTHEDVCFLQIFQWEQFRALAPKPI